MPRITYFDTAMTLIEIGGLRLLTDPVLDPPGTVYEDGPVRLVKTGAPGIDAAALGKIDAVLLSHDHHADNLDIAGRAFLPRAGRVLTTPEGAQRLGGNAHGLAPWEGLTLSGTVRVTAVPALHGPEALAAITGSVTGFVIEHEGQKPIYISGDTVRFSGTKEIAARMAPIGIALLHLGRAQVTPLGDAVLSLDADEGARLATELGAEHVVPIHFEGWQHFSEPAPRDAFTKHAPAARVHWLARGEQVTIPDSARPRR